MRSAVFWLGKENTVSDNTILAGQAALFPQTG